MIVIMRSEPLVTMAHLLGSFRHLMRNLLLTIVLIGLIAGCSRASKDTTGPLSFQSPAHCKVEYQPGIDLYSVMATNHSGGLLMFSRWPASSRPEDVPPLVQKLAELFLKKAQHSTQLTLANRKYHVEKFSGGDCQGSYAIFQVKAGDGIVFGTVFAMSVNGGIWNGQFTGSSNEWAQALTVLKSIRKNR
jgi:hypothetical protein